MQTTRLHISVLTPSISASDLKQRFSKFGYVRDVDGVGKLDGVGEKAEKVCLSNPRDYPTQTITVYAPRYLLTYTTLACSAAGMNLLSGSTWKGAKLRIGEAKPDYKARHERETNPPPPAPRPKLSAAARRRARLKFRLRARRVLRGTQGKQLKDMSIITLETVSKHKKKMDKRKFKLTRARCTVIDPARYGAVHLKEGDGLLGAEVVSVGRDEEEKVVEPVREQVVIEELEKSSRSPTLASSISSPISPVPNTQPAHTLPSSVSHHIETKDPLSLGEWGGRESVSGDEMETMEAEGEGEAAYDVVPRVADELANYAEVEENEEGAEEISTEKPDEQEEERKEDEIDNDEQDEPHSPIKHSSLKDMFEPQEESTSFSLGLDIELDPDAESFLPASISVLPPPEPVLAPASIAREKRAHTIQFTPDPSVPLFFPSGRNDILRVIAEKGWEWAHPGTSEEISAKWNKNKAELTREYTRRHREAMKKRKRGGGTKGDET